MQVVVLKSCNKPITRIKEINKICFYACDMILIIMVFFIVV